MNSRERILDRMRTAQKPFPAVQSPANRMAVTPLAADTQEILTARFVQEAQTLSCEVHLVEDTIAATQIILAILKGEKRILAWDFDHIPCSGLKSALHEAEITVAAHDDAAALFGLTGAEAALAATGSLVMVSGPGRYRTTCLLPQTHIAVITQDQILPNMESWLSGQRQNDLEAFNQGSNINIISGPSRTADIGMELILGMHGPEVLHIIIIGN
jgi:L-lactate dehydrogenase complex protein LldG